MGSVPKRFFALMRRRSPLASTPGQDQDYSPVPEGDALLGTGADQLRAYLTLHPTRAASVESACLPLREYLLREQPAGDVDEILAMLPNSVRAVQESRPTLWDAVFTDLSEATRGGPGITMSPLVVLMSLAISRHVHGMEQEGLLYVASDARAIADRLLGEIPGFDDVVAELMDISRSTIAARATQARVGSVLVHRRFRVEGSLDVVMLQHLAQGRPTDLLKRVTADIDHHALSVWFGDIRIARDWQPATDPGSTSVVVLSVRVPVTSIWLAPRREYQEFLISAEALSPEHVEVLNRD